MDNYMQDTLYRDQFPTDSPGPIRPQPLLHRQPSRNFDGIRTQADMSALYNNNGAISRFDTQGVDRYNNQTLQPSRANPFMMPYDMNGSHTFNGAAHFDNGLSPAMGMNTTSFTSRVRPNQARHDVRSIWPETAPAFPSRSLGANSRMDHFGGGTPQGDDQLIATAIVIKNIPFALKKEELQQHMVNMNLPIPYAFNYHFDNGVFRGLAFANFTSADDTETVIRCLDGYTIEGRKLKVEYKKMLPQEERERIERLKREKRGQLEEQHRPMGPPSLHNQASMSSLSSHFTARVTPSPGPQMGSKAATELDYNDPTTRHFFGALSVFKDNPNESQRVFDRLAPQDRRKLHAVAHAEGLDHISEGQGEERHVIISKPRDNPHDTSYFSMIGNADQNRRGLVRAATMEFDQNRDTSLRPQYSLGQLGDNLATSFGNSRDREREVQRSKSHAEFQRGLTPSPSPSVSLSTSSWSTTVANNGSRMPPPFDGAGGLSGLPSITHTNANSGLNLPRDGDSFLSKSFSSMSLSNGPLASGSPRRTRDLFAGFNNDSQPFATTAPIGSNRTLGPSFENRSAERNPSRQPVGPAEGAPGFERRNGPARTSDELRRDMKAPFRADA